MCVCLVVVAFALAYFIYLFFAPPLFFFFFAAGGAIQPRDSFDRRQDCELFRRRTSRWTAGVSVSGEALNCEQGTVGLRGGGCIIGLTI